MSAAPEPHIHWIRTEGVWRARHREVFLEARDDGGWRASGPGGRLEGVEATPDAAKKAAVLARPWVDAVPA